MPLDWYVARVKRNRSALVEEHMRRWGCEVYNPRIAVVKRGLTAWEELFPGYLFCRVSTDDPGCWSQVMWTPGVTYFLPARHRPSPIGEDAVEEVRSRVRVWNQGGCGQAFRKGDRLRVKSGPLRSLDALFERYLPSKDRCEVFLNWLGRRLLTSLDPADLDMATRSGTVPGWVAGYGRMAPGGVRAGA
jgi:transcription antitermination factor NusG